MFAIVFSAGNMLAMSGWGLLILSLFVPRLRIVAQGYARFVVPAILAVAYAGLILSGLDAFKDGGFSSLPAVRRLFAHDGALTAGWLHYLAFDLFAGAWIVERAAKTDLNGVFVLPCLILTFLFGPMGLLLFYLLSLTVRKRTVEA